MKFVQIVKGKLFVAVLAGVVLVGGATVAFASTPAGRDIVHAVTQSQSTASQTDKASHKNNGHTTTTTTTTTSHSNSCPGLSEAQQLASKFSMNTASTSDDIQALCALHQGTFKGATSSGTAVASSRVLGYGEIEMLLTYAQSLAGHDKANTGGKMTSDNMRSYLAQALQSCGTTPLETCLKTNMPGSSTGNTNGQNGDHGHGNGKPTSTPTPSPHH